MGFPLLLELSFATFAVVYILRYTDGPFDMFLWFRGMVGIWQYDVENSDEIIEEIDDKVLAKLFSCFWCMSTWVSLFLVLAFHGVDISGWLACIGISGFIHEVIVRDDGKIGRIG